jgi:hypothetical protein
MAYTPNTIKQPMKINKESHTNIPAKYQIITIETKAIPKAIKAI